MFYSLYFSILRSTILLTVRESSKILLMDCGKQLHGIAETSKKYEGTVTKWQKIQSKHNYRYWL